MKRNCMLATAVILLLSVARGEDKEEPMQGTWTIVQMERGGQNAPKELIESATLKVVIKGNALRITDGKKGEGANFKRDNSKKPNTIDLVFMEGPKEDVKRTALGIYDIDGDNLKLAWRKDGGERPTKFESIKGERTSELLVLKREKQK